MGDQPNKVSYLGLLNAIAVEEHHGHGYFSAWAEVTADEELAEVLRFVSVREMEHHYAFKKRLVELGFDVRFPEDDGTKDQEIEMARSNANDAEKFEYFNVGVQKEEDIFDGMFKNKTLDVVTGGLLGRYIAEERDSTRRLAERRAITCG